jgi:hypothetical protein
MTTCLKFTDIYCRAYGNFMRRGLDWQLDLLDSTQIHNSWLHRTVHCKTHTHTHTHTNLLSPGVFSLAVTSHLSHNISEPRTTCRPTHCLRAHWLRQFCCLSRVRLFTRWHVLTGCRTETVILEGPFTVAWLPSSNTVGSSASVFAGTSTPRR